VTPRYHVKMPTSQLLNINIKGYGREARAKIIEMFGKTMDMTAIDITINMTDVLSEIVRTCLRPVKSPLASIWGLLRLEIENLSVISTFL